MRAYLQDLRLSETAGYLWGELFVGNAVPGWLVALGSVRVQKTKAASAPDSLRTRCRQELGDRHGQTAGHTETTGPFCSARMAAVCKQASAGIAVPKERRQSREGRGCRDWDGNGGRRRRTLRIILWPLHVSALGLQGATSKTVS